MHSVLRSLLFVPGNSESKLERASRSSADAIVVDWEDSVLPSDRAAARRNTVAFAREYRRTAALFIRINGVDSPDFAADVQAIAGCIPDTVMLSKCETPEHLCAISAVLDASGLSCGICPLIESAMGCLNVSAILGGASGVKFVAFGSEDFCADVEIHPTPGEPELLYARSALVTACRAYGVEPVDSPYLSYRDLEGLRAAALSAFRLGFSGKLAIHPMQVDTLNGVFSPSAEEVAEARRHIDALRESAAGVVGSRGTMIDNATLRRAQRIIDLNHDLEAGDAATEREE